MRVPITPFAGMLVAFIVTSGTAVDAQSHNIPGSGFEVGGWVGGAYADNETGRLSHCFVTAKYDDDSFLSFMGHPSGMLTFGFIVDPKASSSYAVLYIDDRPEIRKPIEIFDNGVAIMEFDATRANLRVFQEGWWLTLDVGGWKKPISSGDRGTLSMRSMIVCSDTGFTRGRRELRSHHLTPETLTSRDQSRIKRPTTSLQEGPARGSWLRQTGMCLQMRMWCQVARLSL